MHDKVDVEKELSDLPFFNGMPRESLLNIADEVEFVRIPRDEYLIRKGDPGDCIYWLLSGYMQVIATDDHSDLEKVLSHIGKGECIGEIAVLTGEPRTAHVKAIQSSSLLRISTHQFKKLTTSYPQLLVSLATLLAHRLKKTSQEIFLNSIAAQTICVVAAAETSSVREFISTYFSVNLEDLDGKKKEANVSVNIDAIGRELSGQGSTMELCREEWISRLEKKRAACDYIVLEPETTLTEWTKFCLAHADHIYVVGEMHGQPSLNEVEDYLFKASDVSDPTPIELVLVHPIGTTRIQGTARWLDKRPVVRHHHIIRGERSHYERLFRFLKGQAIGLVLAGGGARGYGHVGAIRALREAGIPIDLVGGTSIGGIVSGLLSLEPDFDHCLDQIMPTLKEELVRKQKPFSSFTLPLQSMLSRKVFDIAVKGLSGDHQMEDLWLNAFCVSANITDNRIEIHKKGPLFEAIRCTAAIPGLCPPYIKDHEYLVDGLVLDNCPVGIMKSLSQGPIIAINILSAGGSMLHSEHTYDELPSPLNILWSRLNPFMKTINQIKMADVIVRSLYVQAGECSEMIMEDTAMFINLPLQDFSMFDFDVSDEMANLGYSHTKKQLEQHPLDLPISSH